MFRDENRSPFYAFAALVAAALICLLVALKLLLASPAWGAGATAPGGQCLAPELMRRQLGTAAAPVELEGDLAARFLADFNGREPRTNYQADLVLLWPLPGGSFQVALFDRGCAVVLCRPGVGCHEFAAPTRAGVDGTALNPSNTAAKADRADSTVITVCPQGPAFPCTRHRLSCEPTATGQVCRGQVVIGSGGPT